jgi:hypothetical protein
MPTYSAHIASHTNGIPADDTAMSFPIMENPPSSSGAYRMQQFFEAECFFEALQLMWPQHFGNYLTRNFSCLTDDPRTSETIRVYQWDASKVIIKKHPG